MSTARRVCGSFAPADAKQIPFLAARLRYSGAMFVAAFPTERQDAFLLGQRWRSPRV